MNILMLSSEFAPATGGIGTYAREIAAAATAFGARVTVVAPDYGADSRADDAALPFEVARFSGGLHAMRDLPSKIRLARNRIRRGNYDVVHAADWPFFISLALSRGSPTPACGDRARHRDQRDADAAEAAGDPQPQACSGRAPRSPPTAGFTRALAVRAFCGQGRARLQQFRSAVSEFGFGPQRQRDATRRALGIE